MITKIKKVAVLFGGTSEERPISLLTGQAVFNALKKLKFSVVKIDACGNWLPKLLRAKPDFCFIALHGKGGEDGCIQGLLESLNIPYSGSGVLASALAMDKVATKRVLQSFGILTAKFSVASAEQNLKLPCALPVVIKPSASGSAFGVSIARKKNELGKAMANALKYSKYALVEQYIAGREVSVPVLGDRALPVIEIIPQNSAFYDFKAKYAKNGSRHIIPAQISAKLTRHIQEQALRIHQALECRGFSRIDFIIDKKNQAFALEANTVPGMTTTSLFPESAKSVGISFEELIEQMIRLSLQK